VDKLFMAAVVANLIGAGATVGAMFAFSTFIMTALSRLDEPEGIRAMQQINKAVYTPWFMVPFFGTTLLSIGVIAFALMNTDQEWWLPLISAGSLFVMGVFGVTALGNVPLNEKLAVIKPDDSDSIALWQRYLVDWTRWNHVRVVFGALSIIFYSWLLQYTS